MTTQTEQAIRDGVTFIESFNVHDGDVHDGLLDAADTHAALVAALTWMVDQFEDYHDADLEPHQVEQLDGWRAAMDVLDGKSWTPPKAEEA